MSFALDLLQSEQRSSKLLHGIWPVALQPTSECKQGYEQPTDLGASISSSCPSDQVAVRSGSHTASSCSGDGTGSHPQTPAPNSDLATSELAKRPSAAQRKLQSNRQAQKRFRERQKVCLFTEYPLAYWSYNGCWQRQQTLCRKGRILRKQSCYKLQLSWRNCKSSRSNSKLGICFWRMLHVSTNKLHSRKLMNLYLCHGRYKLFVESTFNCIVALSLHVGTCAVQLLLQGSVLWHSLPCREMQCGRQD